VIERTFKAIPEGKIEESENLFFLAGWRISSGTNWQDLLQSKNDALGKASPRVLAKP